MPGPPGGKGPAGDDGPKGNPVSDTAEIGGRRGSSRGKSPGLRRIAERCHGNHSAGGAARVSLEVPPNPVILLFGGGVLKETFWLIMCSWSGVASG